MKLNLLFLLSFTTILISCKSSSINLFKAASPHEQYRRKLETAGLDKSGMGAAWINTSKAVLQKALPITIPYKESGFFSAEKIPAAAYVFSANKGQKITISLTKNPKQTAIYLDLWNLTNRDKPKLVNSADTLNSAIEQEINETGSYLIRLQPELLQSVSYTLEISSGPALAFPTTSKNGKSIQSYWGDGRDNNARKHEGVDIFGRFRSPVLAVANGKVTRVNENNLGGKVVWLRPEGKDYTLYYAHLDEQIALEGQDVKIGDTIGLMGNTGNAKTTPTHLHFGIYTSGGAIDPLPFINPVIKSPGNVNAALSNLNKTMRTSRKTNLLQSPESGANIMANLESGTVINVNAATGNYYKAELPDGSNGFIQSNQLIQVDKPLKKININVQQQQVLNMPDHLAPIKLNLENGQQVNVLGNFKNFQLILANDDQVGWIVR